MVDNIDFANDESFVPQGKNKMVSGVEESRGWCQVRRYTERALEG